MMEQRLCILGARKVGLDRELPGGDFGDGTPSTVKADRYMTGSLTSLGLGFLICKMGVKLQETRCPSVPGSYLIYVSVLLLCLVDSPTSFSKISLFRQ